MWRLTKVLIFISVVCYLWRLRIVVRNTQRLHELEWVLVIVCVELWVLLWPFALRIFCVELQLPRFLIYWVVRILAHGVPLIHFLLIDGHGGKERLIRRFRASYHLLSRARGTEMVYVSGKLGPQKLLSLCLLNLLLKPLFHILPVLLFFELLLLLFLDALMPHPGLKGLITNLNAIVHPLSLLILLVPLLFLLLLFQIVLPFGLVSPISVRVRILFEALIFAFLGFLFKLLCSLGINPLRRHSPSIGFHCYFDPLLINLLSLLLFLFFLLFLLL